MVLTDLGRTSANRKPDARADGAPDGFAYSESDLVADIRANDSADSFPNASPVTQSDTIADTGHV